jgi:hypothetical protein
VFTEACDRSGRSWVARHQAGDETRGAEPALSEVRSACEKGIIRPGSCLHRQRPSRTARCHQLPVHARSGLRISGAHQTATEITRKRLGGQGRADVFLREPKRGSSDNAEGVKLLAEPHRLAGSGLWYSPDPYDTLLPAENRQPVRHGRSINGLPIRQRVPAVRRFQARPGSGFSYRISLSGFRRRSLGPCRSGR